MTYRETKNNNICPGKLIVPTLLQLALRVSSHYQLFIADRIIYSLFKGDYYIKNDRSLFFYKNLKDFCIFFLRNYSVDRLKKYSRNKKLFLFRNRKTRIIQKYIGIQI